MKEGMNERDARRAAMVEVGGVEQVKEEVRAGRTGFALETFLQDLRYGMRSLLKKPGFTLTAVIALALGIGANTAIFSVINGVLLRSLSYANPDRIVMLWERSVTETPRRLQNVISPANFLDWQKQSTSFEHMAAVADQRVNLTGGTRRAGGDQGAVCQPAVLSRAGSAASRGPLLPARRRHGRE